MRITPTKQTLIFLLLGGILLLIVISIIAVYVQQSKNPPPPPTRVIPTSMPTSIPTLTAEPTLQPVQYNTEKGRQFWGLVENSPPLSEASNQAKETLISQNLAADDSVYRSANVRIDYIKTFDIFQAEILTTNLDQAKQEAIVWLKSYGLTDEDLCILPFMFYINKFTEQELNGRNIVFNPLPDGC